MNEVILSYLALSASIWIVYRIFILTKRIVKGWDINRKDKKWH